MLVGFCQSFWYTKKSCGHRLFLCPLVFQWSSYQKTKNVFLYLIRSASETLVAQGLNFENVHKLCTRPSSGVFLSSHFIRLSRCIPELQLWAGVSPFVVLPDIDLLFNHSAVYEVVVALTAEIQLPVSLFNFLTSNSDVVKGLCCGRVTEHLL